LKKIYIKPFFIACLLSIQSINAQNCLDILKSNPLYSNSNDIVNGRKWIYTSGYTGNPMLEENYWPKADILYNGIHFKDIHVNYDIFRDELIVYYPEKGQERYIVINKDHFSGFSFNDSLLQRKRLFEYTELAGIGGKALYEKIPVNKVSFFIRPMIKFDATPSQRILGKYSAYNLYYLNTGKGFTSFRSKRELLILIADKKTEVNKFIRKQNLKINNKHPEDIVATINYFDGLK
jgi:hypothetical protein